MPIYAKVLLWFLLNLLLLAALGYGFMRLQFRLSLDWMLAGPTGERIEQIANTLSDELGRRPESDWPAVIQRHNEQKGLTFALFSSDGRQLLGRPLEVPRQMRFKLIDKRVPIEMAASQPHPQASALPRPTDENPVPPKPRFIFRSDNPTRYWAGIHLGLLYHEGTLGIPLTLVMISDSLTAGGLFLDPGPWIALGAAGLVLSVLLWLPLIGGMTRAIDRLNTAARSIAHGHFEERVPENRSDELGELSSSVNTMAGQLGDYVTQQRRITADIAHELCSPIARMQMALGVVEQRGTPEQAGYLKKLDGELQHMARLVEEVLAFSKAETVRDRVSSEDINLKDLITEVITREGNGAEVLASIDADLQLLAPRESLERALSNLLRNAVRYASHMGPIEITASTHGPQTVIAVRDHGPGVPADALPKLFEPFFRVDPARSRDSGGAGLGLAIVQRCVAACGGSVEASLPPDGGLQMTVRIPDAAAINPQN